MYIKKFYLAATLILLIGLSAGSIFAGWEIFSLHKRVKQIETIVLFNYQLPSDNWSYEKPVQK